MGERRVPLTRARLVRLTWPIGFGIITGAYIYGVVRTLVGGGSLVSALWLPDPVRRKMVIGWTVAALVVALLAVVATLLWRPGKKTA